MNSYKNKKMNENGIKVDEDDSEKKQTNNFSEDAELEKTEPKEAGEGAGNASGGTLRTHRKESRQILAIIAAMVLLLAVWGVSALAGSLIKIKAIEVSGDSPYSNEIIVSASGIKHGMRINKINRAEAEGKILRTLPYISDVRVSRGIFGKAKISVKADIAAYYTIIAGDYFALSDGFRVLEYSPVGSGFAADGLIYISLPHIKSAIIGGQLSYYDNDTGYIQEFLSSITSAGLDGDILSADLSDKYGISFTYNKYTVKIGHFKDIDKKMSIVSRMEKDSYLNNRESAEFDVSDLNNPSIR